MIAVCCYVCRCCLLLMSRLLLSVVGAIGDRCLLLFAVVVVC